MKPLPKAVIGLSALSPGANGQGKTVEETKNNLKEAIELILEDRRENVMRGLSDDAIQEKILIEWNAATWNVDFALQVAISNVKAGNHSIWINPKNGVTEVIPWHNEIKEPLAKKILKRLDAE